MIPSNAPPIQIVEMAKTLQLFLLAQCEELDAPEWEPLRAQLARWLPEFEDLQTQKNWPAVEQRLRILMDQLHAPAAAPRQLSAKVQAALLEYQRSLPTAKSPPTDSPPTLKGPFMGAPDVATQALSQAAGVLSWLTKRRPEVAPLKTFPTVRMPAAVRHLTTFAVEVAASAQASVDGAAPLELPRTSDKPVDFEVFLVLPSGGGVVARSPVEAVLRIGAEGRAVTLLFEVFAQEPGEHLICVAFRHGGLERARVSRKVMVQDAGAVPSAAPPTAQIIGPSLLLGSAFRGLLLQLHARPSGGPTRVFQVSLSGPGWAGPPAMGDIALPTEVHQLLAKLCRELPGETGLPQPEAREQRLKGVGNDLALRVLPGKVLDALAPSRFSEGTALHIESDDAWVPWEMLWLQDPTLAKGGAFLGEHYAVTRWLRTGSARERVGGKSAVLLATAESGLSLAAERRALSEITGQAPVELAQLIAAQQCLQGNPLCRIMHFACHGAHENDKTFAESLALEGGELHATDILLTAPGTAGPLDGTLIFLNACEAGIEQPGTWAHDGWISKLLLAGCGAVVAPSWTITDRGASGFAEKFYRGAATGIPLGEAARRARQTIGRCGNVDRLSYAIYALPQSRLHLE